MARVMEFWKRSDHWRKMFLKRDSAIKNGNKTWEFILNSRSRHGRRLSRTYKKGTSSRKVTSIEL